MTTEAVAAPQLRPLGVGDMIDRVFRMYRQRPLLFITLSAVPTLISVLITEGARLLFPDQFVTFEFTPGSDPQQMIRDLQTQALNSRGAWGDSVTGLISLIPQTLGIAALTYAAAQTYLGRVVTPGVAFRAALADVPRLLVTLLVGGIFFVVVWVLAIIVSALPAIITRIGILSVLIVVSAFVVPAWLFASLSLSATVSAIEDAGPVSSIRRSFRLIAGNRWRLIGILILLLIIQVVLTTVLGAVFLAAFLAQSTAAQVATVLVGAAGSILWEPLPWAVLTLFYYDMRVRKEAFDLQLAAEALPSAE